MEQKAKKVEEIFNDYKTNANIRYAQIESLNIIKKTNTLQINIYFDEYIEIKEIWYFENFLKERFRFEQIDIKIEYHEKVEKKSIIKEWKNIIAYMSHKYPLAKPMLLLKSDVEVDESTIHIKMHIKGASFLKAKKTDKELQKTIKNLFGKEYIIELTEEISSKDMEEIRKNIKKQEEQIIADIEETRIDTNYMPPPQIEDEYIPIEEIEMPQEEQNYIMGKVSKAKENHVKIKDITRRYWKSNIRGKNSINRYKRNKIRKRNDNI